MEGESAMGKLKLGVLASGGGTNLQAIIDNCEAGRIDAEVKVVISNNSKSGALQRARRHNIPAVHLSSVMFNSFEELDEAILSTLKKYDVDLVILAGYMKKVGPKVLNAYRNRVLNIHPAPLPRFGGKGMYGHRVHEAVLASGEKFSGPTVHIVDEIYDHGPIIAHRVVPVLEGDTPDTLAERVLKEEHKLYSEVIQLFAEGRVKVRDDGRVEISGKE